MNKFIYSIILFVVGIVLGFLITTVIRPDVKSTTSADDTIPSYNVVEFGEAWELFVNSDDSLYVAIDAFRGIDNEIIEERAVSNRPDTLENYLGRRTVGTPIPKTVPLFLIWMSSTNYTNLIDTTAITE